MHMPSHGVVDRGASAGEDSSILDVPLRDDAWLHDLSQHGRTTVTEWHFTPAIRGELVRPPCRRQEAAWAWERSVERGWLPAGSTQSRTRDGRIPFSPLPCGTACWGMARMTTWGSP